MSAQAAFKTAQTDQGPVGAAEIAAFQKDKPRYELQVPNGVHNLVMRFDHTRPPFNDIRVRKALHLVTDRDAENLASYDGRAKIGGPMPAGGNFGIPIGHCSRVKGGAHSRGAAWFLASVHGGKLQLTIYPKAGDSKMKGVRDAAFKA